MSEAKELLQAANYANTNGETVRAVNLAKEILERFPESSEATEAFYLVQNKNPTSAAHSLEKKIRVAVADFERLYPYLEVTGIDISRSSPTSANEVSLSVKLKI